MVAFYQLISVPQIRLYIECVVWTDLRTLRLIVDHDDTTSRQALCDATAYFALKEMHQLRYMELFTSHWHIGLTHCQFVSLKKIMLNIDSKAKDFAPLFM